MLKLGYPVDDFIEAALPFSNWGERYFDIRLMEYELMNGLLGIPKGQHALDIGCGIGLAAMYLSRNFKKVDGTDIPDIGVAFRVDRPSAIVGQEIIETLGINNVRLHCGDSIEFLERNKNTYDFIFSHFVLEHVPHLPPLMEAIYNSLVPGGRVVHIVPNTHDTIIQLLIKNLDPFLYKLRNAWRLRKERRRADGRLQGNLFVPLTHSEFIDDYREQFEVNAAEHYLFPMIQSGLIIRDIKPMREHATAILAERSIDVINNNIASV